MQPDAATGAPFNLVKKPRNQRFQFSGQILGQSPVYGHLPLKDFPPTRLKSFRIRCFGIFDKRHGTAIIGLQHILATFGNSARATFVLALPTKKEVYCPLTVNPKDKEKLA